MLTSSRLSTARAVFTRRAPRSTARPVSTMASSLHEFKAKDINGKDFDFASLKGKVVLVTNVASACGYTAGNYKELVALHKTYGPQGLEILAFPCNQFGAQESGSSDAICKFVAGKGVEFTMMEKVDVNGPKTAPVWAWLKSQKPGDVKWNFDAKFIIDKEGKVVDRNSQSPAASEAKIKALL